MKILPFYFCCQFIIFISFPVKIESSEMIDDFKEYLIYSYNVTRYLFINPMCERVLDYYKLTYLLPDPSVLHHYDAFGNLLYSSRDILKENYFCNQVLNYTETFKNYLDHLSVEKQLTFTEIDFSSLDPQEPRRNPYIMRFNDTEMEESSEYWECKYLNRGRFRFEDEAVDVSKLPKTFNTFPFIDVPLRSRFAMVLEVYLIDLIKTFYPSIEGAKLTKFEDLLGMLLFYLYYNLEEGLETNTRVLYKVYLVEILNDLKGMGTIIKLPSSITKSNCFKLLFADVLKFNLFFTFNLFESTGFLLNLMDISPSSLMKRILSSEQEVLIKYHLMTCDDRNCEIDEIGKEYSGKLCHLIYWNGIDWMFMELLKYRDVNWDGLDCRGYTVLGYMVYDNTNDDRYRQFLKKTKMFVTCYDGIFYKNIVDECITVPDCMRGLSKMVIYLRERHKSDDFSPLLVSAAVQDEMDYFERLLEYRRTNCCHELDAAFQLILQKMRLEYKYMYKYLIRLMVNLQSIHGERGSRLANIFYTKWEIQLAKWRAAADEIGIM